MIDPKCCSVAVALRIWNILECFSIPLDHPLSVFIEIKRKKKTRSLNYIDDIHIGTFLRDAAKSEHNITSKKELVRFTVHFIRMGLCGIMHTNESSTSMIQVRLRWKSYAFVMLNLLRNIIEMYYAKLNHNMYLNFIVYHFILSMYSTFFCLFYKYITNLLHILHFSGCTLRGSPK